MAVVLTVLVLLLAGFLASFILLVIGAINFDFSNSEIPPGVTQPAKLRIIHIILICTAVVVSEPGVILGGRTENLQILNLLLC